jgi:murein DD-endopeptidase MepM/ murein hydrolase activator NlpD
MPVFVLTVLVLLGLVLLGLALLGLALLGLVLLVVGLSGPIAAIHGGLRPNQLGIRLRRSTSHLFFGALCLALLFLPGLYGGRAEAEPAPVPTRISLVPPVPGGIVDNWRPPSSPYGPGNRGVDLRAIVGEPVHAVGDGTITFAGQVGGRLFVVIDTGAGLRITLGFLSRSLVRAGQTVKAREVVAFANGPVHVGARQGTTYIDPRPLFARRLVRLTR